MKRLSIFYFLHWLALIIYIFPNSLYLSNGESGLFHLIMTFNTPIFLIIIIKGIIKGLENLFKIDENDFRYVAAFLFAFTYLFTAIDAKVLSIYRDHFNVKLFKILFETGVMQDMGVRSSDIISIISQILLIIFWCLITLFISNWIYENKRDLFKNNFNFYISSIFKTLIVLSLLEKIIFSFFYYTERETFKHYWNSVPSYTPLRMSKVWTPILNPLTKEEKAAANITWDFESDFLLRQKEIDNDLETISAEKNDIDIVLLVFESLRFDMDDPEIMPNLHRLKQKWISSKQHFSNSNCTGNGIFGILTGQTPFYWYPSYKDEMQPIALSIFDKLDYDIDIYTTTALEYSDMHKHIFTEAIDNIYKFTNYGGGLGHPMVKRSDLYKWDEMMVEKFLNNFVNEDRKPSLSFLWFYSTHYNYYFPDSFGKFEPYIKRHYQIYEKGLQKESDLVFNRYKNSAYYVDSQIAKIVNEIEKSGKMENTIIVVVGDHGEEFNEFGRFAHSYSFNNFQTSTPFIMHIPGQKNNQYNITSHADIMPTIIDYINLSQPFNDYLSGKSLIRYNEENDYAIVQECQIEDRPKKFLIADHKTKMEFSLSGNKIESGRLSTINDEIIISNSSKDSDKSNNNFNILKNTLLNKAKKNLNQFSKLN